MKVFGKGVCMYGVCVMEECGQFCPIAAEKGPPQQGQSATAMDEVVIPKTEDFKVYLQRL